MKNNQYYRPVSDKSPKSGAALLIRWPPDLMVRGAGICEVKWMVGGNSGTPTIRASGGRGAGCGATDAEERKGDMGGPIEWAFSVL